MAERRKFSLEFKVKVVLELVRGKKGLMQASREYGIKDTVLSRWSKNFSNEHRVCFLPEDRKINGR